MSPDPRSVAPADPRGRGRVRAHPHRRAHATRPAGEAAGGRLPAALDSGHLTAIGSTLTAPAIQRASRSRRRRRPWSRSCSPAMSSRGASLFGVSRHLREMGVPAPRGGKAWSTATLRGILTNPVYTGKVYAGRVRYRPARIRRSATHPIGHPHNSSDPLPEEEWIFIGEVPEVVGQEQFDLVAQKLSKNKSFARRNNKANEHLLRALVSCGECMLASIAVAKTFGKNNDRKQRYYVCSGKFNKAQSAPEEKCSSRYAPAEQLDEIVWKDLCEVLTHPESITDALRRAHGGEWLPQELKARQENLRKGRAQPSGASWSG